MSDDEETLVFDTGPLSIFACAELLGVLKLVVGKRQALIPDVVAAELRRGVEVDRRIEGVFDAGWIELRALRSERERAAFARFAERLVRGDANKGEAAVLALAATSGGIAVIDDAPARKAAALHGVRCRPTLSLLCETVRDGLLTTRLASLIADELLEGKYRLPFPPGGFEQWATENGVLP